MTWKVGRILIASTAIIVTLLPLGFSQYFDPSMADEEYLNLTHEKVKQEVEQTRQVLADQADVVREATRAYIGAKIKENVFKALRTLAEKELESLSMQARPRQPRQDEDEDEDDNKTITTTERGLIPQLASIVKAIFGSNVNATKYVESASKLLPRPIGNQLVGIVSLLDINHFTSTAAPIIPTTPSPVNPVNTVSRVNVTGSGGVPLPPKSQFSSSGSSSSSGAQNQIQRGQNQQNQGRTTPDPLIAINNLGLATSSRPAGGAVRRPQRPGGFQQSNINQNQNQTESQSTQGSVDNDDDDDQASNEIGEDESRRLHRQVRQAIFKGVNPMALLDGVEAMWKARQRNATSPSVPYIKAGVSTTTESADGFDDEYTTKATRITQAVKAVQGMRTQMEALRKGVPDLFEGAREAYKFLETLNGFLDNWSARLAAGTEAEDL